MRRCVALIRVRMAWLWARMGSGEFVQDNISVWDNKAMSLVQRFKAVAFRWKNATKQEVVFTRFLLLYSCNMFQQKIEFSQDLHHAFTFFAAKILSGHALTTGNPMRQDMATAWNWRVILTLQLWRSGKKRSYLELGSVVSVTLADCGCLKNLWKRWSIMSSHMHAVFYISICSC